MEELFGRKVLGTEEIRKEELEMACTKLEVVSGVVNVVYCLLYLIAKQMLYSML